jgi:NAD(P)-dependent dehydrogenase (short-subunit alcohol dehydrogenase family)
MRRSVLITGAAGGIGSGLVEALTAAGWAVVGSDHPGVQPPTALRQRCLAWISADLVALSQGGTALEDFRCAVLDATESCPSLSLVHNAAVQRFEQLSTADWYETMATNLLAPVAINRVLLPNLQHHQGSIVHIGSIHSQLTKPGFTAYATSKAALAGLTRAMAVELGGTVRINAIEPAAIATPMLEAGFAQSPELKARLESFHPSRSIGTPADVARSVLFLLDPANTFANGCVLPLGGGIHSRLHDPA